MLTLYPPHLSQPSQCDDWQFFLVSEKEIAQLYKRFKRLDRDQTGKLTAEELLSIPEFAMNPLVPNRLINMLLTQVNDEGEVGEELFLPVGQSSGKKELSFKGFVRTLSVFHPKASREEKLRFAFRVYDVRGTGQIGMEEFLSLLHLMVGSNLTDDQLHRIGEQTFAIADPFGKGYVDFHQFTHCLEQTDITKIMSISS